MKKFLSILLALAVGFTFTFGSAMSAFAAADSSKISEAKQKVMETLAEDYDTAKRTLHKSMNDDGQLEYASSKIMVDEANWLSALNVAYSETVDAIADKATDLETDNTYNSSTDVDTLVGAFASVTKDAAGLVYAAKTDVKPVVTALQAQFADYQKQLIANVNAVKVDVYRTDDKLNSKGIAGSVIDYEKKSSQYVAGELMKYAATEIGKIAYSATDDTIVEMTALYTAMDNVFKTYVLETASAPNKAGVITYTYTIQAAIVSKYSLETIEEVETSKNQSLANLAADIATYKATNSAYKAATAISNPSKADYDAYIAAYNTANTWLINNEKGTYVTGSLAVDLEDYLVNNVNEAAKLIKDYEAIKDDAVTYDQKTLGKNYEKLLTKAYSTYAKGTSNNEYVYYRTDLTENAINNKITTAQKAAYIAAVELDADDTVIDGTVYNTYNGTPYYELEWAKVQEAIEACKTAVTNAVTTADITAAEKAFTEAMKDTNINSKNTVDAMYATPAGKLYATAKKEATRIAHYATYVNADKTGKNVLVFDPDLRDYTTLCKWYAANNARTTDEVTALYDKACASLAASKSKSEWEAAAAAAVTQIAALPKVKAITLADKEAIKAAYDAYDAITDSYKVYVTNASTLTKAVAQIQALEELDIEATLKALPLKSTVTVADKEAVKTAKAKIDAYDDNAMYTSKEVYSVDDLLDKIAEIEADNVMKLIEALPAPSAVKAEDKAAIEAARAAFDAYIAEYAADFPWHAYELGWSGDTNVDSQGYEKTLIQAEEALAGLKWTADDAKAYVQDLSIAVRTAKVGKKVKVTVNADVQTLVDNGYTVTYKFYKSTKKSSGYKNTVNKTTNTYTNTNPVKGKNYYKVKLVVKNADGAVVATTPLTQCKYGVRTIK